jgi:hypothetical protein
LRFVLSHPFRKKRGMDGARKVCTGLTGDVPGPGIGTRGTDWLEVDVAGELPVTIAAGAGDGAEGC